MVVHSSHRPWEATKLAKALTEEQWQLAYTFVFRHSLMMLIHIYITYKINVTHEAMGNANTRISFLCLHMQYETK